MESSNWINFLLLLATLIAAGISWRAVFAVRASAREANETQKRLIEIEEHRDTLFDLLERTPNLSATKINLREAGKFLSAEVCLTNMSRHAIHLVAVAVYNAETNDLLALGKLDLLVQASERIDRDLPSQTTSVHTRTETETGLAFRTTPRAAVNLLDKATQIDFYFRYAPNRDATHKVGYQLQDIDPLMRAYYIGEKRMVPFNPFKPSMTADVEVPEADY